ncbi:hypothetical protein ACJMK2_021893 [Sinanodonta woodiana]|uniref:DNA 3'-5' helicase n=1 Tax=Sinanodonta woodiana TaxID=1069815 RepID=A0ABD3TIL0_SINWO
MKRCTILCTTPVLNENISINIRSRIPSTGGRHTVEGAYDYVYKPLLLELHRNKRLLGSLFWMDCERPDETACVVQFHSQHPEHVNQEILKKLSQDVSPVRLVFATIALGMGCDLRHVKRVIHACPPSTLESYTQEIGRAGRDGSIAQAMLYYNATDLAHRYVDKAIKDFFKSNKSTVQECCDICANYEQLEKHTTFPSLEQRHQVMRAIRFSNTAQEIEFNFHLSPIVGSAIQSIISHVLQ